jgi:endonuclease/exonuclease/phosphatase family metal-dependent hydrolase
LARPPGHFSRALVVPLLLILALIAPPLPARDNNDDQRLLETGAPPKPAQPPPAPDSIKIISYNIRWRGGEDLRRLIQLLKTDPEIGGAAVVGLQEVDRNKKRTGNVNTARLMAEELGMYYAWAAPPPPPSKDKEPKEEETGVAILSAYPLTDVKRLVLPYPGPGGRRRAAIGATVRIGERSVRVYSVHAELRTSNEKRLAQFRAVLEDLAAADHARVERAVVLGDFNTLTEKDVDATAGMFEAQKFSTPFDHGTSTWKTFIIQLKLDWLWLRGLKPLRHGIDKKIGLSDHWPLWVEVRL